MSGLVLISIICLLIFCVLCVIICWSRRDTTGTYVSILGTIVASCITIFLHIDSKNSASSLSIEAESSIVQSDIIKSDTEETKLETTSEQTTEESSTEETDVETLPSESSTEENLDTKPASEPAQESFSKPSIPESGGVTPTQVNYPEGWVQDEYGNWKWQLSNGSYLKSGWIDYKNERYYIINETMAVGWYILQGTKYYFDYDGVMVKNEWIDGCYLSPSGYAYVNTYEVVDGITYYFDPNGHATRIDDDAFGNENEDDFLNNDVEPYLYFSDDVGIQIRPDEDQIFNLTGSVSSRYGIKSVAFDFYTPDSHWPYGENSYNGRGPNVYYLEDINTTINSEAFEFGNDYIGDYKIIITVTDIHGNKEFMIISWSYSG